MKVQKVENSLLEQGCWRALLDVCVLINLDLGAGQNEIQDTRARLADTDRLEDGCGEQIKSPTSC